MNKDIKYGLAALILLIVIIGGAYYLHATPAGTQAPAPAETAATSTPKAFSLVVKERTLVSGPSVITAKQGDTVSITITADESDELHLHGYDKHVAFEAGKPATLTFVADQSGRFPFEMEGSKTDLGEVDVQP